MADTITINDLSIIHKNSGGVAKATLPNVCLTPSPNGPVPINYPNTAYSKDLAKGTTTITAGGEHMCAVKGSQFSKSCGDEAGSLGGILSGTHQAEATWLTYSPNVFFEGRNACRFTDKMLMNGGNTACAAGVWNPQPADADKADINAKLKQKIVDAINSNKTTSENSAGKQELKENFAKQLNADNPAETISSSKLEERQANLKKNLKKLDTNNSQDLPEGAWSLTQSPVPEELDNAGLNADAISDGGNDAYKAIDFLDTVKMPENLPADCTVP